jgi:ABC-type uncharacterized transport system substrate-binding protein
VLALVDPEDPIAPREVAMTREAAATLGLRLTEREMSRPEQAEKVFAKLQPGEVQGVFVVSPSLQTKFMGTIVRLAWEARLPFAGHGREWVEQQNGALFSYSPKLAPSGAVVARYIDSIQQGGESRLARHDGSPQRRSNRAIACAISSGQLLRLHYLQRRNLRRAKCA